MPSTHLYELLVERVRRFPRAIALGSRRGLAWQTFDSHQVLERVDRLAAELAARGVGAGDRVVLWLPNHAWAPMYLFALWKLGAIAVPFDREMNVEGARRIIGQVEPALVLTGYGERPAWAPGDGSTEWWEPGTVGSDEGSGVRDQGSASGGAEERRSGGAEEQGSVGDLDTQSSLLSPHSSSLPTAYSLLPTDALAVISYTSGTTGAPKGCVLTHANLLSQLTGLRAIIPIGPDCRLASILPLSHVLELTVGLLYPLASGAAIHYVPSRRAPDILRVLAEQRVTHIIGVPQLLTAMGQAIEAQLKARLPAPIDRVMRALAERLPLGGRRVLYVMVHRRLGGHLRVLGSGGAALPPETHRLWERLGVRVIEGYGTSECSPIISGGAADGSTPVGSVGKPLPGVEVRLSAEGEILVRGPNVMRGYWRDPERTAAALSDGWFHTGDLGRLDQDGNLWLLGRAKEMIVLPSGLKVWPSDIEDVVREHPAVKDVAVVAVPAAAGGMTLHAYLLPQTGEAAAADPRAIIAAANARLAVHQRVATASWWPAADFPRTTILKIRRHLLPLPDAAAAAGAGAPLAAPVLAAGQDPAVQAILGVARLEAVEETATLGELGFDSLTLVELALALEEKTGVAVTEGDLDVGMTVAAVRALVGLAPAVTAEVARVEREQYNEGGDPPRWAYGPLGGRLRWLGAPFDWLYRYGATRTIVLGGEHLRELPARVVLAGTHHSFADLMLVRQALRRTPARHLTNRLVVPAAAWMMRRAGPLSVYAALAFGLYPLRQYRDQERSLRLLAAIAGAGQPVLIFPQGHHIDPALERAGDPAAAFKTGAAHIAQALDAVVVPFGLAGSEGVVPPTSVGHRGLSIAGIPVVIRRGPLAIAFGAPLRPAPGESTLAFTQRLQAACFALTRQAEAALGGTAPAAASPPAVA